MSVKNERVEKITDQLQKKLASFEVDAEELDQYLEFCARFYQGRSHINNLLIFIHKMNSELVATYKQWKTVHNRIVVACTICRALANAKCKCSDITKPIRIPQFRPLIYKYDKEGDELEEAKIFYADFYVYDIEDTEPLNDKGLRVHNPNKPILLKGSEGQEIIDKAKIYLKKKNWSYDIESDLGGPNGLCNPMSKEIKIKNADVKQMAKTTIHELSHFHLHGLEYNYQECRGIAEVQAESVAYTVLKFLGLDSSDYSIRYIIGWSQGDSKRFKESLKEIVETSQQIIKDLELTEGELENV